MYDVFIALFCAIKNWLKRICFAELKKLRIVCARQVEFNRGGLLFNRADLIMKYRLYTAKNVEHFNMYNKFWNCLSRKTKF